jgi:LuxR family maltose regulon positive regulatory protein
MVAVYWCILEKGGVSVKKLKTLKRNRVNRELESIFEYPLTVVEAPIGYGKTTAVREFLSSRGSVVLWLSFLSSEDTASFFWDSLSSEIGKLDAETGARLKNLGFPNDAPQIANILSILNGLDFEEDTALVIDDFHLVNNPQIGSFLTIIAREQPEKLHVAIITRDTSNLDISELTAKGLCNILPQQTLCFTDAEIRDYCDLMGYKSDDTELEKISEYTGGWISMVYLTLLGVKQGIPVGKSDVIDELVENALFNTYNDSVRSFLLKLSVMDAFTFASPHLLYTYYKEPGKLKKITEFIASEFPSYAQVANGCGTGCEYLTLAEYALETGNWQDAELNAFKAIYKAKT